MLLLVFVAVVLLANSYVADSKAMFYIYEWVNELDDLWPPPGAKLHPKSGYSHEFRPNNGAGTMLDSRVGLFNTWQFSLYRNLMNRLRVSEYRTRDPEQASAFIVPVDLGINSYIDHQDGRPRLASPHGWAAGYFLINASKDKKLWWKNHGHDHFVIFSITAYQMVGIGTKVFFMQICQNCSTITIETSPTRTAIKGRTRKHTYAVPYPSSYHWYEGIQQLPWLPDGVTDKSFFSSNRMLSNSSSDEYSQHAARELKANDQANGGRDILALIIGSVRTAQPTSNNLRKLLYNQCETDKDCQWHKTAHSCSGVLNATGTMLLIRRAKFCPAPTGDSVTRKSLFDSLVAGCIPVLFSRASLTQYSWHLSEADVDRVSIYIPMTDINEKGINFLHVLRNVTPAVLREKQNAITEIAPRLQYSVVPSHIGNGSDGKVWKPPFRDAADVVIEKILDRNTIEPISGFTDEQLLALVNKQNEIMDTHEDYAALRGITKVTDKMQTKVQIAKGMKGITKLLTTEKFRYPAYGALMLSKDFIPPSVFSNTDIVEYREGRVRHITGSKIPNIGIDSDRSKEESGKVQPVGRLIKSESTAADKICRTALDCD